MFHLEINPYVRDYVSKDYAGSLPEGDIKLDCSLGVNADLLGNCIFQRLHAFEQRTEAHGGNFAEIKYYPHGGTLKEALANWYRGNGVGEGWLTADHIILGNGSYDILCNLNLLCLTRGKKVLGHAPQFTAYVDHVNCTGSVYECCYLDRSDGYRFHVEDYLDKMSAEYGLFIVENPINPTGLPVSLEDIGRIAQRAENWGKLLVVDEAYAEYLPFSASAINLIPSHPNLIVTRSFSKGWGMAGVRLGYGVSSTQSGLLPQLEKLVLPFNSNGIARVLAQTALETKFERPEDPFGIQPVIVSKRELLAAIERYNKRYGRNLRAAATCESTPILMLYVETEDPTFHLQRHLIGEGLLTVSCESYVGLDCRAVRLMLPEREQMPLLLELLEKAVRTLPER